MIKYIIYLDTKIKGALYQTINYFKQGVFDENTLLLYKEYVKIDRLFKKELKKYNINFQSFKRYKDMPNIDGKIVFYLFNAQSNCRIVANRKAKHIFVTHGESNKVSSIKPIIRIYDHIIVAGDLGIDRYLYSEIFYKDDIQRNKVIKMGNTFIGDAKYSYNNFSKAILYAPTWEGGVIEENYSSLDKSLKSFITLNKIMKNHNIQKVYIQPHPNTGHRDIRYIKYLLDGLKYLAKENKNCKIILDGFIFKNIYILLLKFYNNIILSNNKQCKDISFALTDISAMEIQLLSKNIPVYIFSVNEYNLISFNENVTKHYKNYNINNLDLKPIILDKEYKNYSISYQNEQCKKISLNKRIEWLAKYIIFSRCKNDNLPD